MTRWLVAGFVLLAGCNDCRDAGCRPTFAFSDLDGGFFEEEAGEFRVDVPRRQFCENGLACAPLCVDTRTDHDNCGACGNACAPGAACTDGRCCSATGRVCNDACVELATDPLNCGACGRACAALARCAGGECRPRALDPRPATTLGSRRPRLRWGGGAARAQVCRDAACASVVATLTSATGRATVADALAPGRYFWRVGSTTADRWEPSWPLRIDRRDTAAQGALPPHADVDGDGLDDVVVVSPGAGRVLVFAGGLASTAPAWTTTIAALTANAQAFTLAAGDLDGDGAGELFVRDNQTASFVSGAGPEVLVWPALPLQNGAVAVAGDTDLDGRVEVALSLSSSDAVTVLRQGASFGAWERTGSLGVDILTQLGSSLVAPGDVDGDGYGDLVASASLARVVLFQGSTAGFGAARTVATMGSMNAIDPVAAAGDVNGDGAADLVVQTRAGARVLLGGATPVDSGALLPATADGVTRPNAAGDVDGDGYSDLVAVYPASSELRIYRGGTAGPSTTPTAVTVADAAHAEAVAAAIALGDVDGDGADDVALALPSRDEVVVLFGDAAHPFARAVTLRGEAGSRFGAAVQ